MHGNHPVYRSTSYAEDKGGSRAYLGDIVGAQSSESVVDLINSIDSKGLKGSPALALGKALANAENRDVKAISESIQDSPGPHSCAHGLMEWRQGRAFGF